MILIKLVLSHPLQSYPFCFHLFLNYINKLLDRIKGKDSDKPVIKSIKSGMKNPQLKEQIQQCGYVIQEYIKFYMDNNSFINIDISSINFMLSIILNPISNKTPFFHLLKLKRL